MQNLVIFCQSCFAWVEPYSDQCPECGLDVPLDRPDPGLNDLEERLGRQLTVFGPIRIERQGLPSYGHLIATTCGVLFLPRLHRRINGAWEGVTSQRLPGWWPFRGDDAAPRFLSWLRKPFGSRGTVEEKSEPILKPETLADRLMDSPGSFFVEQRVIHKLTIRRRTVKIERPPLRSVTIIDETEEGSLGEFLNSLANRTATDELKPA